MIVKGSGVIDQWGDIDTKITSYSIRKSLISARYGIYSVEGVIDVNQTRAIGGRRFPRSADEGRTPSTTGGSAARVLVSIISWILRPSYEESRPPRGSHAPGTFWYYNNWDFNAIGTIFEKMDREDRRRFLSVHCEADRDAGF
jgi:hypothetical protein